VILDKGEAEPPRSGRERKGGKSERSGLLSAKLPMEDGIIIQLELGKKKRPNGGVGERPPIWFTSGPGLCKDLPLGSDKTKEKDAMISFLMPQ